MKLKLGPGVVAAVTGASSGIGQELAFQLASRGCKVALAARRLALIQTHAEKIRGAGGEAIAVAADVSQRGEVENLARRAFDQWGRLDLFINNAGISPATGTLLENSEEDFRRTMEVNLMGGVYGVWAAAPLMEKSGGGTMVFVSSIMGKRGAPRTAAYCASKFAIQGLTECVRSELVGKKIHVLTVCPPGVDTPFFEVNGKPGRRNYRLHPVSKIAGLILDAIEAGKREILPTMDAKLIYWANVFAPAWVDRMAIKVKGAGL